MKSEDQIVSEIADALDQRHRYEKQKYCVGRRAAGERNPELNIDGWWIYNGKGDYGYYISFEHIANHRILPVSLCFEFRNATVVVNGKIAFNRNADLASATEALWHYVCNAIWKNYELREFVIRPSFFRGSEVVTA